MALRNCYDVRKPNEVGLLNSSSALRPWRALAAFSLCLGTSACHGDGGIARTAVAGVLAPCPGTADPLPANAPCGLVCRAELPLVPTVAGQALIDVRINDAVARLQLDTGADLSVLRGESRDGLRFGLPTPRTELATGVSGEMKIATVTVRSMEFGHVSIRDKLVDVVPQYAMLGSDFNDGLLGNDILSHFQVDLDIPHGIVRLYDGKLCPGPLPGWAHEDGAEPFAPWAHGREAIVAARIGDTPAFAYLDTGSSSDFIGTELAHAAGVSDAMLATDIPFQVHGIDAGTLRARRHLFDRMTIGPEIMTSTRADVGGVSYYPQTMLIGETFFRTHKVWIDYAARVVHFAHDW